MTTLPKPKAAAPPVSTDVRIAFGKRLQQERLAAGLNQPDLAALTGIGRAHISDLERGKHNVTIETAMLLARALGFDVDLTWKPLAPPPGKRSDK